MDTFQIASICHQAIRQYNLTHKLPADPDWGEATDDERKARERGVEAIIDTADFDPEVAHMDWMASKLSRGWQFGPNKDRTVKTHPALLPWKQLPDIYKRKAFLFCGIVRELIR